MDWKLLFPPGADLTQIHPANQITLGMQPPNAVRYPRIAFSESATRRLSELLNGAQEQDKNLLFHLLRQDITWDPSQPSTHGASHNADRLFRYLYNFRLHPSMRHWLETLALQGLSPSRKLSSGLGVGTSPKRIWMLLRYLSALYGTSLFKPDFSKSIDQIPELRGSGAAWLLGPDAVSKIAMVSPLAGGAGGSSLIESDLKALESAHTQTKKETILVLPSADQTFLNGLKELTFPLEVETLQGSKIASLANIRPPITIFGQTIRTDSMGGGNGHRKIGRATEKGIIDLLWAEKLLIDVTPTKDLFGHPDAFIERNGYVAAVEIKSIVASQSVAPQMEEAARQILHRFKEYQMPQEIIFVPDEHKTLFSSELFLFWKKFSEIHPEVHLKVHLWGKTHPKGNLVLLHEHEAPAKLDYTRRSVYPVETKRDFFKSVDPKIRTYKSFANLDVNGGRSKRKKFR